MVTKIENGACKDTHKIQAKDLCGTYPCDLRRAVGTKKIHLVERIEDAKSQDKAPIGLISVSVRSNTSVSVPYIEEYEKRTQDL